MRGQLLLLQIEADRAKISSIKDIDKLEKRWGVKKLVAEIEKGYKDVKTVDQDSITLNTKA
ncbi:hypothetical protein IIC44_01810 [Patescibacteria group bacterium]|nr:hypothetical protein [Patescibacteria group bacterium]